MKKFAILSIMALLLAGCSDREPMAENGTDTSSETSFLSVSIVASGAGTRTITDMENGDYKDDNNTENDPTDDGYYRDGTAAESYVNEVLFLFFDDKGSPAQAIKVDGGYQTYYLWTVSQDDNNANGDHTETVEKIIQETITIIVPHNQAMPKQLFAVVNPTSKHKADLINKQLSDLINLVEDYEFDENDSNAKLSTKGKFVMTNSVYYEGKDENKEIIYTTKIKDSDYYTSASAAADHPITVYVERVLARIDLKIKIDDDDNNRQEGTDEDGNTFYYYYTGTTIVPEDAGDTKYETPEKIYVRFLGWNVFDTPNKSRLIKKIDTGWTNKGLFGLEALLWNSADYHRSFWAINPAQNENEFGYRRGPFEDKADLDTETGNNDNKFEKWYYPANNNPVPAPGDTKDYVTAYFQENAAPYESEPTITDEFYGENGASYVPGAPVQPSKVILAAQLVDESGKPRPLAKWAGKYYWSWDGLATQFCNSVLDLYYVTQTASGSSTSTELHRIKPEHLTYKSTTEGSYKVTVVLSEEGEKITWFHGNNIDKGADFDETKALSTEEVNEYIASKTGEETVMVWTKGYTYFYFTIRHLGYDEKSPAYYGVVRNHIYEATVNKVSGLGTPVADPNDTITVTPPKEDEGILAAQVRILSWRLVSQSYDLNW